MIAFERYVSKEREKYDKMMARSKEKAAPASTGAGSYTRGDIKPWAINHIQP